MESRIGPTHAGGVVYRNSASGAREFLLVTARRTRNEWVHPKGHIEPGESPEQAACREVLEEAGVEADIVGPLPDVDRTVRGERQRIRYFVMSTTDDAFPGEGRDCRWLTLTGALGLLTFPDLRTVLEQAEALLQKR